MMGKKQQFVPVTWFRIRIMYGTSRPFEYGSPLEAPDPGIKIVHKAFPKNTD